MGISGKLFNHPLHGVFFFYRNNKCTYPIEVYKEKILNVMISDGCRWQKGSCIRIVGDPLHLAQLGHLSVGVVSS